jgi:hypothetical protein
MYQQRAGNCNRKRSIRASENRGNEGDRRDDGHPASRQSGDHKTCRDAHMNLTAGSEIDDMNQELLIQQTKVESQALEHITRALEVMIGWAVDGGGYGRKLSSVRFFTVQYQQHLERLFALEEIDGYMESVSRLNPELSNQVDDLKRDHEQLRAAVRKIVVRLDLASPTNLPEFDATCFEVRITINDVLEHLHREQELLVEAFQRDTGGES